MLQLTFPLTHMTCKSYTAQKVFPVVGLRSLAMYLMWPISEICLRPIPKSTMTVMIVETVHKSVDLLQYLFYPFVLLRGSLFTYLGLSDAYLDYLVLFGSCHIQYTLVSWLCSLSVAVLTVHTWDCPPCSCVLVLVTHSLTFRFTTANSPTRLSCGHMCHHMHPWALHAAHSIFKNCA